MQRYIKIHPNDNVAVALAELAEGETVSVGELNVVLKQAVERGHKFALLPLAVGELVNQIRFADWARHGAGIGR